MSEPSLKYDDSVLLYPDADKATSGNTAQTHEADFTNLTIIASKDGSNSKESAGTESAKGDGEPDSVNQSTTDTKAFSSKTRRGKIFFVLILIGKILAILVCLYFFVCALDVMSKSLKLIGGRSSSELLTHNSVITNPIAGVMIGLLVTVAVQSSSASTSVAVSMVSTGLLTVPAAIPIIMGANIGTSVTNTLVAFTQLQNKEQFEKAFAGATVHDLFNALTTVVLLTLEVTTSYLFKLSQAIVGDIKEGTKAGKINFLHIITRPLTECVIVLDKKVEECWLFPTHKDCQAKPLNSLISRSPSSKNECVSHMFRSTSLRDIEVGVILFLLCLAVLCFSLIMLVKVLNSILKGHIATVLKKTLNSPIPCCPCLTGYVAILVGAVMTFIVQSSSVFTSALTPLVGLGVISVELMYPLTLGANIGTTTTALLSALAVSSNKFKAGLQIALCHLLFNISGIILFYPLPFMRWPIMLAKKLGRMSAQYRWFTIVYILTSFLILPLILFGLSVAGTYYALGFAIPVILLAIFIAIVNTLQVEYPKVLCSCLKTWDCLPLPLRSLEPYNNVIVKIKCCRKLQAKSKNNSFSAAYIGRDDESEITVNINESNRRRSAPKASNISLNSFLLEASGTVPLSEAKNIGEPKKSISKLRENENGKKK